MDEFITGSSAFHQIPSSSMHHPFTLSIIVHVLNLVVVNRLSVAQRQRNARIRKGFFEVLVYIKEALRRLNLEAPHKRRSLNPICNFVSVSLATAVFIGESSFKLRLAEPEW